MLDEKICPTQICLFNMALFENRNIRPLKLTNTAAAVWEELFWTALVPELNGPREECLHDSTHIESLNLQV